MINTNKTFIDFKEKIENNIKELYLASSSEVYQTPDKIPTDEKEPLRIPDIFNPRYSYAGGKIITELMGINNAKFFKKMIIFRPHNIYGPNQKNHFVPEFINRCKKGKIILFDGSKTKHEVLPITFGTRYTNATWYVTKTEKEIIQ